MLSPSGRVCFLPPGCVVYQYDLGPTTMIQNDLLAVPAGPGQSVAYTLGLSNAARVSNWDIVRVALTSPEQLLPTLFRCGQAVCFVACGCLLWLASLCRARQMMLFVLCGGCGGALPSLHSYVSPRHMQHCHRCSENSCLFPSALARCCPVHALSCFVLSFSLSIHTYTPAGPASSGGRCSRST